MRSQEKKYIKFLKEILKKGKFREDRTGTGTITCFSPKGMTFYLKDGKEFPLMTNKFVNFDPILKELLWFISGSTNINDLDSKIWNQWASENGDIGKMYGYQLRLKDDQDPLQEIINNIIENPNSRRHCLTLWNHKDLPNENISPQENVAQGKGALACCHGSFLQFYVEGNKLSLKHYQRSVDAFIGGFFNVASYALLLIIVARIANLKAHKLILEFGDAHIYQNHLEQVNEYLSRDISLKLPSLKLLKKDNIDEYKFDDFILQNYLFKPKINAPIAI